MFARMKQFVCSVGRGLCAIWLSMQVVAISLSHAWGLFVPHEHVKAEQMSPEDWRVHWAGHESGYRAPIDYSCGMSELSAATRHNALSVMEFDANDAIGSVLSTAGAPARATQFIPPLPV